MSSNMTETLKAAILEMGASMVGVADLDRCRQLPTIPEDLFSAYQKAMAIALLLPVSIFDMDRGFGRHLTKPRKS